MFNPARLPDTTCRCGPSIVAVTAAAGALFIICLSCAGIDELRLVRAVAHRIRVRPRAGPLVDTAARGDRRRPKPGRGYCVLPSSTGGAAPAMRKSNSSTSKRSRSPELSFTLPVILVPLTNVPFAELRSSTHTPSSAKNSLAWRREAWPSVSCRSHSAVRPRTISGLIGDLALVGDLDELGLIVGHM